MNTRTNSSEDDDQYNRRLKGRLQRDLNDQRYQSEISHRADAARQNRLIRELIRNFKRYLLVFPVLVFMDIMPILFYWGPSEDISKIVNDPTPMTPMHMAVIVIWILAFLVSFVVFSKMLGYLISYPIVRAKLRRIAGEADWKNPETKLGFMWKLYMAIVAICIALYFIAALVPIA
ncbi:MAG: hypothetical protein WBR29_01095 [Gammaproteobacteria bacterium]